jgi:hypothetical protein
MNSYILAKFSVQKGKKDLNWRQQKQKHRNISETLVKIFVIFMVAIYKLFRVSEIAYYSHVAHTPYTCGTLYMQFCC